MRRQSSLHEFYKSKSSPASLPGKSSFSPATTPTMNDKNIGKKRRSLSLIKHPTPEKSSKMNNNVQGDVISLCSDDENTLPVDNDLTRLSQNSNVSETTIIYNTTPSTPFKSPKASSTKSSTRSPNSGKFYSPTQKKAVTKRMPVRRNISLNFGNSSEPQCDSVSENIYRKACEGMDDKSVFLLTTIKNCLENDRLKSLLDERSLEILNSCLSTIKPGIRLVCRLFWRQQGWYRKEKLNQIIDDKKESIAEPLLVEIINYLVGNGIVKESANFGTNTMDFDDLMKVLKGEEVKNICKHFKLKINSKQGGESALRSFSEQKSIGSYFSQGSSNSSNNSKRVLDVMKSKVGPCYRLSDAARDTLDKLHLLMYLGMNYEAIREKRLELILINDKIGKEIYPISKDMKLDDASVVFRSEEEFSRYWHAHVIYEDYLSQTNSSEKCDMIINAYNLYDSIAEDEMLRYTGLPTWLRRYTPPYIYVKILATGIQELKKNASYHHLALDILTTLISQSAFREHKKAHWYSEKALILYKLMGKHDEAAEVLIEGLSSALSEESKDAMRPRANKLANQQNIQLAPGLKEALSELASKHLIMEKTFPADHVLKQHMETTNQRGKKKFKVRTEEGKEILDAEAYCILDYTTNGDYTHGEHWEGRIVTTMFHLLFWDIIYTAPPGVRGVFLSYYQLYPLDMFEESFYSNRKTVIDDRLETIKNMSTEELLEEMRRKWDERPECELSGLNRGVGWDNVSMVSRCLGPRAAAALVARLATGYGYHRSGFPDLTLWNVHTDKIKFVEVKTDTDKPSMKQLQWLRYLRANGMDAAFCYVGVAAKRQARVSRELDCTCGKENCFCVFITS